MSVGTKGILAGILDVFDKIKTELKFNEETRKEYRRKISTRTSEWVGMVRRVAESIEQKADGKRPIIFLRIWINWIQSLNGRYFTTMRQCYRECRFRLFIHFRLHCHMIFGFRRWKVTL